MEVPVISNLNDNGDRLRPKGKDAFKDQQKESEVNSEGCLSEATTPSVSERRGGAWGCACIGGGGRSAERPSHAVMARKRARMQTDMRAGRHRGVILATGSYK